MRLSPSCLCCLPGRPLFPCLLASAFFSLRPCFVWPCLPAFWSLSCFVCVALFFVGWFVCWLGLFLGLFGLCCALCLPASGWSLGFASVFWVWLLLALPHSLLCWSLCLCLFALSCSTKVLIYHCTCVSVRRLDRYTCTFGLHR